MTTCNVLACNACLIAGPLESVSMYDMYMHSLHLSI